MGAEVREREREEESKKRKRGWLCARRLALSLRRVPVAAPAKKFIGMKHPLSNRKNSIVSRGTSALRFSTCGCGSKAREA